MCWFKNDHRPFVVCPLDWNDIEYFNAHIDVLSFPERDDVLRLDNKGYGTSGMNHQFFWWASALSIKPQELKPEDFSLSLQKDETPFFKKHGDAPYIVIQPDTISDGKQSDAIFKAQYRLPAYTVGKTSERLVPYTHDARGMNLTDVARLVSGCHLFVGINSSITILASMMGKPTIMNHFESPTKQAHEYVKESGVTTSVFRGNLDLITPTAHELESAMSHLFKLHYGMDVLKGQI